MKTFKQFVNEHIIKTGGGYKLVSKKSGKNLGTANSLSGIKKREREVEYFKHMKEDGEGGGNSVAGIAGTGDTRLATDQREPGVSKKKKSPIISPMGKRNPPQI